MHIFHSWSRWEKAFLILTWPDHSKTRREGQLRTCAKCGLQENRLI